MPSASFGAIKLLQKRTGADRATCKAALEAHDLDEDAAATHIANTTAFTDSAAAAGAPSASVQETAEQSVGGAVSLIRLEVGDGVTFPEYGDTLYVHYRGTLAADGQQFDSSYGRNKEFSFRIGMGQVIEGWDVGMKKMSVGEKAMIFVPAAMAYGAAGMGPVPPNADLKFEVHLTRLVRQTSCVGPGQRDSLQTHEYGALAKQMLGMDKSKPVEWRLPEDRKLMPLTSEMPQ